MIPTDPKKITLLAIFLTSLIILAATQPALFAIPLVFVLALIFFGKKGRRWPMDEEDPADWWKKGKHEEES